MIVLQWDPSCYIWFALGKYPFVIDLAKDIPIAERAYKLETSPELMQKYDEALPVEWENLPLTVKNCIISTNEVILERNKHNAEKKQ